MHRVLSSNNGQSRIVQYYNTIREPQDRLDLFLNEQFTRDPTLHTTIYNPDKLLDNPTLLRVFFGETKKLPYYGVFYDNGVMHSPAFKQLHLDDPSMAIAIVEHIIDEQIFEITNVDWLYRYIDVASEEHTLRVFKKLRKSGHFTALNLPERYRSLRTYRQTFWDLTLPDEDLFVRCMGIYFQPADDADIRDCHQHFKYLLEIVPSEEFGLSPRPEDFTKGQLNPEEGQHFYDSREHMFNPRNYTLLKGHLESIIQNRDDGESKWTLLHCRLKLLQRPLPDLYLEFLQNSKLQDFCPITLSRLIFNVRDHYPNWRDYLQFEIPKGYLSGIGLTSARKKHHWIKYGPLGCTDDSILSRNFNPYTAPPTLNGRVVSENESKLIAKAVIESATKLLETFSRSSISRAKVDLLLSAMGYLIAENRKLDFSNFFRKLITCDWEELDWYLGEGRYNSPEFLLGCYYAGSCEGSDSLFDELVPRKEHPMLLRSYFTLLELRKLVDSSLPIKSPEDAFLDELNAVTNDLQGCSLTMASSAENISY